MSNQSGAMSIPAEPRPLPSLGLDEEDSEESFVVLSNGSRENSPVQSYMMSFLTNGVKEMQEINNMEIAELQSAISEQAKAEDAEAGTASFQDVAMSIMSGDNSLDIQNKIMQLIRENENMKSTVAQNNLTMRTQYDRIILWKGEVEKSVSTHKMKLQEAKQIIDNYKKENVHLQQEVEKYKELKQLQDEEIMKYKQNSPNKTSSVAVEVVEDAANRNLASLELQIAQDKVTELEKDLEKTKKKNYDLSEQNEQFLKSTQDSQDTITKLKKELDESKAEKCNELKNKESEISDLKKKLNDTEQEFTEFKIQKQLEFHELIESRAQLQEQLTNAQVTLTAQELQIAEKVKEIESLRKLLQESSAKSDEFFALKNQLDVYKSDYEEEKASRDQLKRERDQIANDLKNLQRRNQELQDEIEVCRDRGYVVCRPGPSESDNRGNKPQAPFNCPKCNFGFTTYAALENHVHRCLDLDGFP